MFQLVLSVLSNVAANNFFIQQELLQLQGEANRVQYANSCLRKILESSFFISVVVQKAFKNHRVKQNCDILCHMLLLMTRIYKQISGRKIHLGIFRQRHCVWCEKYPEPQLRGWKSTLGKEEDIFSQSCVLLKSFLVGDSQRHS